MCHLNNNNYHYLIKNLRYNQNSNTHESGYEGSHNQYSKEDSNIEDSPDFYETDRNLDQEPEDEGSFKYSDKVDNSDNRKLLIKKEVIQKKTTMNFQRPIFNNKKCCICKRDFTSSNQKQRRISKKVDVLRNRFLNL